MRRTRNLPAPSSDRIRSTSYSSSDGAAPAAGEVNTGDCIFSCTLFNAAEFSAPDFRDRDRDDVDRGWRLAVSEPGEALQFEAFWADV